MFSKNAQFFTQATYIFIFEQRFIFLVVPAIDTLISIAIEKNTFTAKAPLISSSSIKFDKAIV